MNEGSGCSELARRQRATVRDGIRKKAVGYFDIVHGLRPHAYVSAAYKIAQVSSRLSMHALDHLP